MRGNMVIRTSHIAKGLTHVLLIIRPIIHMTNSWKKSDVKGTGRWCNDGSPQVCSERCDCLVTCELRMLQGEQMGVMQDDVIFAPWEFYTS